MHQKINVVILSSMVHGGAGKAAFRLHRGLQHIEISSTMLVLYKTGKDPDVKVIPCEPHSSAALHDNTPQTVAVWNKTWERWQRIGDQYPQHPRPIEIFSDTKSLVDLDRVHEIYEADIIHFHWIAGLINFEALPEVLQRKKIIWTMHDMNPFTGGCHYSGGCDKYIFSCSACPMLGSQNEHDAAWQNWQQKAAAYAKLDLYIVSPSKWLAKCAAKSSLFSGLPIMVIPYGIPVNIFKPLRKDEIRKRYNIPEASKVILFGADYSAHRKGFHLLTKALNSFIQDHQTQNIIFASFGSLPPDIQLPPHHRVINLGRINNETGLAKIYNLADVFVMPSVEDNLPNVVLEAMACGLPVVGFGIGGISDVIVHKKTGYLAQPYDVEDFARGIQWVLFSDNKLSQNCREKILKEYTLEHQAQQYLNCYKKVLSTQKKNTSFHQIACRFERPLISILLPTKDRHEYLQNMLESIPSAAAGISYEVLLLYGDSTVDYDIERFSDVKVFIQEKWFTHRPTWPEMMNFLLGHARGEYFMYASDDIILEPNALAEAVRVLKEGGSDVAGVAMAYKNAIADSYEWSKFGIDLTLGDQILINYGLIRTDIAKKLGGFSDNYKFYCADGDLCLRMIKNGYKILPALKAHVVHNNMLDNVKHQNLRDADRDIQTYRETWKNYFHDIDRVKRILDDAPITSSNSNPTSSAIVQTGLSSISSHSNNYIFFETIQRRGLWKPGTPLRLHLGCGERRLEGYINIDLPPAAHSVQTASGADVYIDITQLILPEHSVDEIRLHHVFEHFERPLALAQLIRWHEWLKINGLLIIETPDFEATVVDFLKASSDFEVKQALLRHLFGSHEARWAVHRDGWYEGKFEYILQCFGFRLLRCEKTDWKMTRNIIVTACKERDIARDTLLSVADQILSASCVDESPSERKMLATWQTMLRTALHQVTQNRKSLSSGPRVSIIMPVYNAEKYLHETITSILNQTYSDFELIIVDDGSQDRSLEIAREAAKHDPRIKIIACPHRGEVAARNEALRHCSPASSYIMNHDSDDISLPQKLETLVTYLEQHPTVAIVGCLARYIDDTGTDRGMPRIEVDPDRIRETFADVNSMINSASLIRRDVFEKIGTYRKEFRSVDDYDFFARALMAGFVLANIPETLHLIRLHSESISATRAAQQRRLEKEIQKEYRSFLTKKDSFRAARLPYHKIHKEVSCQLDILFTVEFYSPHIGGSELVVQHIAERLVRRGHRVTVATTRLPERDFCELNGVNIIEFSIAGNSARGITGDTEAYLRFLRICPHSIVVHYAAQQWATDLAFSVLRETAARRVNILAPCGYSALLNEDTLRWPQFQTYFTKILPQMLPLFDAVVYHSAQYTDYRYGMRLGLSNSVVIPNGTDEEEFMIPPTLDFRQRYGIQTKYMGLCVANYLPGKGQERVIACVRAMGRDDFTMVFIGKEGSERKTLERFAKNIPNVLFLTDIPRKETVAAFHAADIFLFGSHIEASPLVILEAKASRTPFVSTDCGNVKEWKGGIVCEAHDMAFYANRILDDENLRKRLAEEGWKEWKERLTWSAVVDQWEELMLRLHQKKCGHKIKSETLGNQCVAQNCWGKFEVILFSKDRPLQLDATLRSFALHVQDREQCNISVLYTTTNEAFHQLYERLRDEHPDVTFIKEAIFKNDLLRLLRGRTYILFLVDDALFVRDFSLAEVVNALEANSAAIGFSLRLGRNTTYCYMLDKQQHLPVFTVVSSDILSYDWTKAEYDFGYPLEVSSSVYRACDIVPLLEQLDFRSPNTLEAALAARAAAFRESKPVLMCFETSRAFCAPMNKVQKEYESNRSCCHSAYSPEELARLYREGKRINVAAYNNFTPQACHQEIELVLTGETGLPFRSCVQDHEGNINAAERLVEEGRFGEAETILRSILSHDPDNVGALNDLAVMCYYQGKTDEAQRLIQSVLERDPTNEYAKANRDIISGSAPDLKTKIEAPGYDTKPLVSVVIPCYNQAHFLPEAVESIVQQTYPHWECIIVNDGSPDNTSEVARRLIERYPNKKIRLLEKANGGLADARNAGIALSRGGYILPLDADDKLHPLFLEKTVSILDSSPIYSIVYVDEQNFGDSSHVHKKSDVVTLEKLLKINVHDYCSLYRKDVWKRIGGYSPAMYLGAEDWNFWIGAAKHGFRFYHLCEPLFLYRNRAGSMVSETIAKMHEVKAHIVLHNSELFSQDALIRAEAVIKNMDETSKVKLTEMLRKHPNNELLKRMYVMVKTTDNAKKVFQV